jgi:2-hydroxy-3-oxopropionate reductase
MSERIGFIGLGIMGRYMAANLVAAGHDVLVWNRGPEPQRALVELGAEGASGPDGLAREADVVITMLSDDAALRAVLQGERGVLAHARPRTLVIDMSTVSPALSKELAVSAARREVRMLDAPVSGGDVGAREGTLSIMVGGEAEDVQRAKPLFEVLGSSVVHVGPAGAGQVVKACNQVLVAVIFAGVSEALVLGSKLGVEPSAVLDALSGGMAANRIMEMRRRNFLEHDFAPGFKIDLHHKDLGIALDAAGQVDVPLPLGAAAQQMLRQLRAAGCGDEDDSALLRVVEAAASHRTGAPLPRGRAVHPKQR